MGINLPAILIANAMAVGLIFVLLLSKNKKIRVQTLDERIFMVMCCMVVVLSILETIGFVIDGVVFPGGYQLYRVLNSIIFCLTPLFAVVWLCYVDFKLFEDVGRLQRIYPLVGIPVWVVCLFSIANIFTDVFYSISRENVYIRLPAANIISVLIYLYLAYGAVLVFISRKKVRKYIFMPILIFLLPVYIGSFIQIFCYGVSLIWVGVAFGLTSLYINLQNEASYLDDLTSLYNRNYLLAYFTNVSKRMQKDGEFAGLMIDINSFKQINDTYGHIEGDHALQTVGHILRTCAGEAVAARYGGDEFVILLEHATKQDAIQLKQRILTCVQEYNAGHHVPYMLSLSIGSCCLTDLDIDVFFSRMDEEMYQEKRKFYADAAHNRRKIIP